MQAEPRVDWDTHERLLEGLRGWHMALCALKLGDGSGQYLGYYKICAEPPDSYWDPNGLIKACTHLSRATHVRRCAMPRSSPGGRPQAAGTRHPRRGRPVAAPQRLRIAPPERPRQRSALSSFGVYPESSRPRWRGAFAMRSADSGFQDSEFDWDALAARGTGEQPQGVQRGLTLLGWAVLVLLTLSPFVAFAIAMDSWR